jgi:hypothetical protein
MDQRLQLQALLEDILDSRNVYFQPPEDVKILYPCIIYSRGVIGRNKYANNKPYSHRVRYTITVVDPDPDSIILDKISELQMCAFERHYTKDNLNHDVYNLYY